MSDLPEPLSSDGERRRERILQLALGETRSRKRRRWALRGGAGCAAIIAAVAVVRSVSVTAPPPMIERVVIETLPQAPLPRRPSIVISRIETDPTIVDRLAIRPQSRGWQIIGDDELLRSLADAGHSAGLIHVAGHALLLPHEATPRWIFNSLP